MGVIVYKTSLSTSSKNPNMKFVKFKMSDLSKYKTDVVNMVKSKDFSRLSDQSKVPGFQLMKFSMDKYQMIDCILFNNYAQEFASQARYGDVVLLK